MCFKLDGKLSSEEATWATRLNYTGRHTCQSAYKGQCRTIDNRKMGLVEAKSITRWSSIGYLPN